MNFSATFDGGKAFPESVEGKTLGGEVRIVVAESGPVLYLFPGEPSMRKISRFIGWLRWLGEGLCEGVGYIGVNERRRGRVCGVARYLHGFEDEGRFVFVQ